MPTQGSPGKTAPVREPAGQGRGGRPWTHTPLRLALTKKPVRFSSAGWPPLQLCPVDLLTVLEHRLDGRRLADVTPLIGIQNRLPK